MIVLAHGIASHRKVMTQFSHGLSGDCNTKTITNDHKKFHKENSINTVCWFAVSDD
ncbi:hypothetical protein ACMAUO_13455 [Gluconacetobacter sp. Hr-1-5]|uniref:hypothetical protein n=1 Tax=Gluconacetobacter sp. Hr-1-5 TaxID=3395370 RepID=UPI003B5254B2